MWSDNESKVDLLGFEVHAKLIQEVILDPELLPVTIGVFGDWGGGKSTIMGLLNENLQNIEEVCCLYFNGWIFEGYEDAKSALLTSILVQLGEHKRFGPKIRDKVINLLKRVKWMDAGKMLMKVGAPIVAGLTSSSLVLPTAIAVAGSGNGKGKTDSTAKKEDRTKNPDWNKLLEDDKSQPGLLEVRKFKEEFSKMLSDTGLKSLVILVDDLDRCLPERVIDTLEAIKLFVSVEHTAFIIGADPRIVRHAIAKRYVEKVPPPDSDQSDDFNLVKDYLEKLIQIPYHLPRLAPSETETYINLLACQKHLPEEQFNLVLSSWRGNRKKFLYAPLQQGEIKEYLGRANILDKLEDQLHWSNKVSPILTEGLKGNPRQIKRMLNAMFLRQKLANVAGISIEVSVLAKLMVLEYVEQKSFKRLSDLQASSSGFPLVIKNAEKMIEEDGDFSTTDLETWNKPSLKKWLAMDPQLSTVDLRDYFWLARDKTQSSMAGLTLVSPFIRKIFLDILSENNGIQNSATKRFKEVDPESRNSVLQLMGEQANRSPENAATWKAYSKLCEEVDKGYASHFIDAVSESNSAKLSVVAISHLCTLYKNTKNDKISKIVREIAKSPGKAGKAAQIRIDNGDI